MQHQFLAFIYMRLHSYLYIQRSTYVKEGQLEEGWESKGRLWTGGNGNRKAQVRVRLKKRVLGKKLELGGGI